MMITSWSDTKTAIKPLDYQGLEGRKGKFLPSSYYQDGQGRGSGYPLSIHREGKKNALRGVLDSIRGALEWMARDRAGGGAVEVSCGESEGHGEALTSPSWGRCQK